MSGAQYLAIMKDNKRSTCKASFNKKKHWTSSVHSILSPPSQCGKVVKSCEKDENGDGCPSSTTICATSSKADVIEQKKDRFLHDPSNSNSNSASSYVPSGSVSIPYSGLYGFTIGRRKTPMRSNASTDNDIHFESKLQLSSKTNACTSNTSTTSSASTTRSSSPKHGNETKKKKVKSNNNNTNKKWTESLPSHCGCTFRAKFQTSSSDSNPSSPFSSSSSSLSWPSTSSTTTNKTTTIILPFTSQCADPRICNVESYSYEKESCPGEKVDCLTLLTSQQVARLIYIREQTKITVECLNVCTRDDCHEGAWEWNVFLHQYNRASLDSTSVDNSASLMNGDNNDELKQNITNPSKNQSFMNKDCSVEQCNEIKSPHEKRARLMSTSTTTSSTGTSISPSINQSTIIHSNTRIVDFFPKEARKKPVLCTTCYKKFPNAVSIKKHAILAHIDTIVAKGSKQYIELIGPDIIRKPLIAAYEDDHVVVVVKHQGLTVMGDKWTLWRSDLLLPFSCKNRKIEDALSKPRPVHRLDSATGGLLVAAKTHSSETSLKRSFAVRTCKKRYRAIVFGKLEAKISNKSTENYCSQFSPPSASDQFHSKSLGMGTIDSPLNGKDSTTHYSIIAHTPCMDDMANGWITTVDLYPVSGRTHQLRRHMKLIGHPIWGDLRYAPYKKADTSFEYNDENNAKENIVGGDESDLVIKKPHSKLCLWALEIIFPHPFSNDNVHVNIDEPKWYQDLREFQNQEWQEKHT